MDRNQFLRQQHGIAIVFERLAIGLLLDRRCGVQGAASTVPNCWISSTEPLSPMPGAPGMLSMESPRNAITSITRCGRHTEYLFHLRRGRGSGCPWSDSGSTRSHSPVASCPCRWTRCRRGGPLPQGGKISVPITSSASKPSWCRMGMPKASKRADECRAVAASGPRASRSRVAL